MCKSDVLVVVWTDKWGSFLTCNSFVKCKFILTSVRPLHSSDLTALSSLLTSCWAPDLPWFSKRPTLSQNIPCKFSAWFLSLKKYLALNFNIVHQFCWSNAQFAAQSIAKKKCLNQSDFPIFQAFGAGYSLGRVHSSYLWRLYPIFWWRIYISAALLYGIQRAEVKWFNIQIFWCFR